MIEYTPNGLWEELEYAEQQNERRTKCLDKLRRGYYTPAFGGSETELAGLDGTIPGMDWDPENHAYEFASYVVPQLVAGNPKFALKSRKTDDEAEEHDTALALEFALNQWIQDVDFRSTMDALAPDALFAFGAVLVSPTKNKATYQQSCAQEGWPEVQRISPRNFFRDPAALRFEECRYFGHRWAMAAQDLRVLAESEPDAGWDRDWIEECATASLSEDYRPKIAQHGAPKRGEVELFELWFPAHPFRKEESEENPEEPTTEKEGFHGTIYTLCLVRGTKDELGRQQVFGDRQFVRKPRPYFGHKSGPYAHCGMMRVPDDPWFLAPLVATSGQAAELNALARANSRDVRNYKKLIFVDDDSGNVAREVESGQHQTVVPVKNIGGTKNVADMIQQAEVGGPSQALAVAIEQVREQLRRASGMGEAQTGNAPGSGTTATAVAVAAGDAATRLERIKEQWRRFLEDIGIKVAFYIGTSDTLEIVVDANAAAALGSLGSKSATLSKLNMSPSDFENMHAVLDVMSVERTTEERVQARVMQATALLTESIPLMMQVPDAFFWGELFETLGNALNVPDLAKLGKAGVAGALKVLSGDIPSLATMPPPQPNPDVSATGGGKTQGSLTGQARRPGQQQNRTPGLSGVQQMTPLAGVGGTNGTAR